MQKIALRQMSAAENALIELRRLSNRGITASKDAYYDERVISNLKSETDATKNAVDTPAVLALIKQNAATMDVAAEKIVTTFTTYLNNPTGLQKDLRDIGVKLGTYPVNKGRPDMTTVTVDDVFVPAKNGAPKLMTKL